MDYPPFTDAVARFRLFLNDQGYPGPIGWVFSRDVLLVGGRWFIRPRSYKVVVPEVAIAYETAVANRLGVKFGVLCRVGMDLWCHIYCPKDQVDAEHRLMPDGLKVSVGTPPEEGRIVVDEWEWERLRPKEQVDFKQWQFR